MDIWCLDEVDLVEYIAKECGVDRAGIIGASLVHPSIDPTDENLSDKAWWETQAALSPPLVHIIKPTRGDYPGGTPTEEEGYGRETVGVTGADHVANIEAPGMKENRNFWEGKNRKKWKLAFVTNGDLLYFVDRPVTIYATPSNPRDPKASAFWKITNKWQDFSNPRIVDMPEDIFETAE